MQLSRVDLADGLTGWSRGTGKTVIWLHGYTLDSTLWDELWALLPGFRHVGIDLPGHGASRPFRTNETLQSIVDAVLRVCGDLQARHLVGISFGSLIALQAGVSAGDALDALILAAPTIAGMTPEPAVQQRNMDLLRLYRASGRGQRMTDLWLKSPPDIFKGAECNPALFARIQSVVARHSWKELDENVLSRILEPLHPPLSFSGIRARTLVVVGEGDMPSFRRNAELLKRHIPGCTRRYMEGLAHLPLLEAPALCAALLQDHLDL